MQPRTRSVSHWLLLLLILAAFGLRVYQLDTQSLWYDEGVTAEVAQRPLADLTRWTADDIQPPLYYYVVAAWGRLAGWSEWSLRFASVFFGVLTVPLLAEVTIALTRRRVAGLLAASMAAFHPLLLYYSQEARMYAMLTALGVLLGYLVIKSEATLHRRRLHWTAYVLVATAAIYTHYFAFFVLLALALAYLIDQRFVLPRLNAPVPEDEVDPDLRLTLGRRPILGFVIANLVVLLLYAPWITALLRRWSLDSSYWQGAFKYQEALRHIAISFTSGETVLEAQATPLLAAYGLLTVISLIALLWRRTVQPRTIIYALLWLIVPIAATLSLATITPKFNPRYVMIALPGLLLLWSAGLTALIRLRGWHWAQILQTPFLRINTLLALVVVLLLHTGFFFAVYNWYRDPAFTKAEWRAVSDYIRFRVGQDSGGNADHTLIALVSGHAWPVWDYYAPDLPALRLPDLEILDVNAVLDYGDSAARIHEALAGYDDVWLVQWQADIVDPMNIVPLQLELAGKEEELDVEFWQVRLRHFRAVDAAKSLAAPVALSERSINFGNAIYLLDYGVAANGDLLLYWQLHPDHPTPMPDLQIVGETFTADGLPFSTISDRRPVGYGYPTGRWQPGEINLGRIPAVEWAGAGALAGPYLVRLSVYDSNGDLAGLDMLGSEGQPVGRRAALDLDLPIAAKGPDRVDLEHDVQVVEDIFMAVRLLATHAEPGQGFPLEFQWYAEDNPETDMDVRLRWRLQATGEVLGEQILRLSPGQPISQWPDDERLRNLAEVRPPLDLPAAAYWLEVGMTAPESLAVRLPFQVTGSSRIFSPPPYQTPIGAIFGERLLLHGVIEPLQIAPRAGEQVAFTLVWQAVARMRADYTTTVQWLDSAGKLAGQADLPLPRSTRNWLRDQVELQTIFIDAPDLPGDYRLVAAVYDATATDFPRLLTPDGRDLVDLGTVTVQP